MKKLKFIVCAFSALLFTLAAFGGSSCKRRGEYAVPSYQKGAKMDIGVWDMDPVWLELFAEAGFNLAISSPKVDFNGSGWGADTQERAIQFLNRAQAAGVKVIVRDSAFCEPISEYSLSYAPPAADKKNVHLYKDNPAFYGLLVSDEPFSNIYPHADAIDALKFKAGEVRAEFPGKVPFINIAVFVTNTWGEGGALDMLMKEVKPEILSFDEYVIMADKTIGSGYLTNLAKIKRAAAAAGVPACSILLATGHETETRRYATPDYNTMRWQVACNQTFGYDAFLHYAGDQYDDKMDAIIKMGKKTQLYEDIKAVHAELRAWEHVYLSYKWEGVAAVLSDESNRNDLFTNIPDKTPANKIPGIKKITNSQDVLVGIFKDADGNRGYMLTNASNPWQAKNAYVNVTFDGYKGVQVWADGEPQISDLDENGKTLISLAPGQGKFLIPLKKK